MSCKYLKNISKGLMIFYIVKSNPTTYPKLFVLLYENMNFNSKIFTQFARFNSFLSKQYFLKLRRKTSHLMLWTVSFLSPSSADGSNEVGKTFTKQRKAIKSAIEESDELFESNKYPEASAVLLPYKECDDVELLWRLSRTLYNQAQDSVVSEEEKRRLIHEAYNVISKALELDDDHWAVHQWMSVLIDADSAYSGIKARLMKLEQVKEHMLRAAELNPNDATIFFMLGSWCYQVADIAWFPRKIAAIIFAPLPSSSFEEALKYFSKAEEIKPKFYSKNLLMLGKTLLKLHREVEAVPYLNLAKTYPIIVEEDDLVRKEAKDLLKKIRLKEG